MGTIYNVPISWTRDTSKQNEYYNGLISLNYPLGNTINGTWKEIRGAGITIASDGSPGTVIKWNYLDVLGNITQGEEVTSKRYNVSGSYYPNGRTYSYSLNYNLELKQADRYTTYLEDKQYMFDVGTMTLAETIPLEVTNITVDKPRNFSTVGTEVFNNITVKWEMASTNQIDYQIIQDGATLINKTNQTGKQIVIPYGTLKTTNSVTVKVRTHFNFCGTEQYSEWVSYTVSGLKGLVAEIPSNIRIMGTERAIEENIIFAWDTTEALCRATVEVWQDGNKITEQNNIIEKQYILRAGILQNTNTIKIRVKNTISINGYMHTSNYKELTVNDLVSIKPVLNNISLNSFNRDHVIQVEVTATGAERYEVFRDTVKITEGTGNILIIPEGSLLKGTNTIKVIAYRLSSAGLLRSELLKQFDIVQDEPLIYSVEPSNININVDELSTVSFATNNFIDRWELFINSSFFIAGTTERQIQIDKNIFTKGENALKVIVYYSPTYNNQEVRQVIKQVTFNGYGKPKLPILDTTIVYASATPNFTWITGTIESDAQVAFEVDVHTENKIVNSVQNTYTMMTSLENNNQYVIRLRIKNKFELWSDWVEKEFTTSFSKLPKPIITLSPQKENVLIIIQCDEVIDFKQMSLYRSIDKVNWIEIANDLNFSDNLTDFLVCSGVETFYKVRVYDNKGGYNESDIKCITVNLFNYNLLNIQKLKTNKQLDFVAINFKNNFTSVAKIFAGACKPAFYKGNSNYLTASMTVKLVNNEVNKFIDYIREGQIFCYRDYKGKKIFVCVEVDSINYINPFMQEVVLALTEVNFNEILIGNKGNYTKIIYLDGEYLLDGSLDLSSWGGEL